MTNTTEVQTLTSWLLDRISEDEAAAREAINPDRPGQHWHWVRESDDIPIDDPAVDKADEYTYGLRTVEEFPTTSGVGDLPAFVLRGVFPSESLGQRHIARHDPARVLAECAAKRAIVDLHSLADSVYDADGIERPGVDCRECWGEFPCPTLRHVAAVYANHPDYDQSWAVSR